jgi:hypothetical protein
MIRRPLIADVRDLLASAAAVYGESPEGMAVEQIRSRLDEPLRVAIAGRVKAGKSTLLNALVGEELAPTDAGECTKIVTWYQHGHTYRVYLDLRDGSRRQARFTRDAGAVDVDLAGLAADEVERIVIEWPSSRLRDITLVDTPGIASANAEVSARTARFLASAEDEPTQADAVLYLMRHLHTTDLRFLESFHDDEVAKATPINAIGVLSRCDEIGVGRPDAMRSAQRIAARYRRDPKLRGLCQTVLPLAGLIAETGTTLTEDEFRALTRLAREPNEHVERMLLSTDRFMADDAPTSLTPIERRHLLARLGMFGVRISIRLLRQGTTTDAGHLAETLVKRSGLIALREELLSQFAARRDTLKARSALLALEKMVATSRPAGIDTLEADLERVMASAHEFAEIRVLNAFRRGTVAFPERDGDEIDRLLGARGQTAHQRLGLPAGSTPAQIRSELLSAIARWRRRAENPLSSREVAEAAAVLVRSCEGMLVDIGAG